MCRELPENGEHEALNASRAPRWKQRGQVFLEADQLR